MPHENESILDDLRTLPNRHGSYTLNLLETIREFEPLSINAASNELIAEVVPFSERLTSYVANHFKIANDIKAVKRVLRNESERKHLEISSANLSQWITSEKWEVTVSPQNIFKLCLAMNLDLQQSQHFTYECLYQNWLNLRIADEAIYLLFLGNQELFGTETYQLARGLIEWHKKELGPTRTHQRVNPGTNSIESYTRLLGAQVKGLSNASFPTPEQALESFKEFLIDNEALFTGVQQSATRTYLCFFREGAIGIKPLRDLYFEKHGWPLPDASYMDNAYAMDDPQKKRLLWGTTNRREWLRKRRDNRNLDILPDREIRTEEHAVSRMISEGVPRGNIVALLFFHFCYDHEGQMESPSEKEKLFEVFYRTTNQVLVDECGMMPLHPRKSLDRLFMQSLSRSGKVHPIVYLNQLLEDFYSRQ